MALSVLIIIFRFYFIGSALLPESAEPAVPIPGVQMPLKRNAGTSDGPFGRGSGYPGVKFDSIQKSPFCQAKSSPLSSKKAALEKYSPACLCRTVDFYCHPSMAMVFFSWTAFASFLGMLTLRIPFSNFALISSWVSTSPT